MQEKGRRLAPRCSDPINPHHAAFPTRAVLALPRSAVFRCFSQHYPEYSAQHRQVPPLAQQSQSSRRWKGPLQITWCNPLPGRFTQRSPHRNIQGPGRAVREAGEGFLHIVGEEGLGVKHIAAPRPSTVRQILHGRSPHGVGAFKHSRE